MGSGLTHNELRLWGGIDAGGTTFKCGVVNFSGQLVRSQRVKTEAPEKTVSTCAEFFLQQREFGTDLAGIGLGTFGPVDLDPSSPHYGSILETPKPLWSGFSIKHALEEVLGVSLFLDTDVNGALLGELRWGAARGCRSAAYVTIGTGVGAAFFANGDFLGRPSHPEFGHSPLERHEDDTFPGLCPFHAGCIEGMLSAPAIEARFGSPQQMSPDHPGWEIISDYLGQVCQSIHYTIRPQIIILGGGVMLNDSLLRRVHKAFIRRIGGYLTPDLAKIDAFIRTPALGDHAGLIGAASLAMTGENFDA